MLHALISLLGQLELDNKYFRLPSGALYDISCMSCVHDMSRGHYFAHVVWLVGTRHADVR